MILPNQLAIQSSCIQSSHILHFIVLVSALRSYLPCWAKRIMRKRRAIHEADLRAPFEFLNLLPSSQTTTTTVPAITDAWYLTAEL
jgi:hypothetical protein